MYFQIHSKCDNFGWEQYFFISKKFLVTMILLNQKQQNSRVGPRTPLIIMKTTTYHQTIIKIIDKTPFHIIN